MFLSSRVKGLAESITMKLNERSIRLAEEGRVVYNLSAGQLPIKPPQEFIDKIHQQLNFLKSYQYSSVAGDHLLRKKILQKTSAQRDIKLDENLDVILSNGTKHSIYNALGAILDPGDEIIILIPYWVSYPEMIKFWGGIPITIKSQIYDSFFPAIEDIKKAVTPRTKAIIINSPNNPAGIHYSNQWMNEFAQFAKTQNDLWIISDEVYSDITYFDPKPSYFYQMEPSLLEKTIIVNGISKSLACTGLRIGYAIGPKNLIQAMSKIQGQTTSGPSSLIQRSLEELNWDSIPDFLGPVKNHLRKSANLIREKWHAAGLQNSWYQPVSAFYFMVDFTRTPCFKRYQNDQGDTDFSSQICEDILESQGITMVPGSDFGLPNSARMSLVMEEVPFEDCLSKLVGFLMTP